MKQKLTRLAGRTNTFFARSNPIVLTSDMDASVRVMIDDTTLAQRCREGASTPSISARIKPERSAPPSARPAPGCSSPDLNPIEKLFAKIKHGLRKAQARTRNAVSDALAETLQTVSPKECQNYFKEAGYERT